MHTFATYFVIPAASFILGSYFHAIVSNAAVQAIASVHSRLDVLEARLKAKL